jgi:hypothetical protein
MGGHTCRAHCIRRHGRYGGHHRVSAHAVVATLKEVSRQRPENPSSLTARSKTHNILRGSGNLHRPKSNPGSDVLPSKDVDALAFLRLRRATAHVGSLLPHATSTRISGVILTLPSIVVMGA